MASKSDARPGVTRPRALAAAALATLLLAGCAGRRAYSAPEGMTAEPSPLEPTRHPRGALLALIDSGLDPRADARIAAALAPGARDGDLRDVSGHGTALARRALEVCRECRILPIAVTAEGPGITPPRLAAAITRALDGGARVINLSLGLDRGSAALRAAIARAADRGVPLVAAAGVGVPNPYRPRPLRELHPQSDPAVIVINSVTAEGAPNPDSNHGPEITVSVAARPEGAWGGSSLAAVEVSAALARELGRGEVRPRPDEVRRRLREAAEPLPGRDPRRVGAGRLEPLRFRWAPAIPGPELR
jgi:membrane-anchored mycosin MYCP